MEQVDPPEGKAVLLKCTGGCIRIYKATFGCLPDKDSINPPFEPAHVHRIKGLCDDREECTVHSCAKAFYEDDDKYSSCDKKSTWVVWG